MTTYNTGNAIGSTDARDRLDNAENMDYLENSTTKLTHADRLGTVRKTRHGMEVEHDAQIAAHETQHDAQMRSFEHDFDGRLAGMGFTRVGTFNDGYTLTDVRQTLLWEISQGGDGQEYGWGGAFPKVVPASSTPASTGGISVGAWISRFDPELRIQVSEALRRSYAEAGYNLVAGSFETGGTLVNANDVLLHNASGKAFSGNAGVIVAGTNPASGGFVDRSAERRKHYPDDIAEFGYVYGSGIDGSASVLAAIAKTGGARITGATTLSRFDWPSGARLTGSGKINYMRVPNTPCNLNSELPVDHSLIKAVFVHQVYDICDMLQLKTAGFNTLIHYGQFGSSGGTMQKACDAAEAVGLKLILGGSQYGETDTPSSDLDNRECVIGYYLYDEPQMNSISVEQQQSRISAFKAFTEKALVIADFGNFSIDRNTHTDGYDIVFCDAYYNDNDDDSTNKRQAVIGWAELKYKCPSAKILPCVGLFSTDANGGDSVFKNKQKQISFAKKFFDMGDGGYCAFSWESHLIENTHRDVQSDSDFYALAKELNSRPRQKAYDCDVYAFRNGKIGDAMLLYNKDYSSADVSPFHTINVGSIVDERSTSFERGGIAVKNAGGVLATNLKNHGYIAVNLFFYNGADNGSVDLAITTCVDDFYTNIDQISKTLNSATRWASGVKTTPGLGVGLRITPSLSYQYRWKFLNGMIVDCAWSESTF